MCNKHTSKPTKLVKKRRGIPFKTHAFPCSKFNRPFHREHFERGLLHALSYTRNKGCCYVRIMRNSANCRNSPRINSRLYPSYPLHTSAPVMTGRRRAEFQFALATSPLEKSAEFKAGVSKSRTRDTYVTFYCHRYRQTSQC